MSAETLLSISKIILYVGTVMVAAGSIAVAHFTAKTDEVKDQKIDSLLKGNKRLEDGSNDLLTRIGAYQADLQVKQQEIEALKKDSARAKRGVISQWDFNGARREESAGRTSVSVGDETIVFGQFLDLERLHKFQELLALAESQLSKTPDWLTPRLYRGVALANLGRLDEAKRDLQTVLETAAGDSAYSAAAEILRQIEARSRSRP